MKSFLLLCALAAAVPVMATAQEARSTTWVNLRAGPARDYPLVARLGPGTPLAVQGCTEGFGWCDVIAPRDVRGWIYAGNIAYPYQSADVPVLNYGAAIGFPIITFMIGDYWDQYYRNRPWYGNHDGAIDRLCSGHAVTCLAGVSRISDVRVRTNIGRNSDRPVTIDLAVPGILVTIDRRATRGLRAEFNTEGVLDDPIITDPQAAIGIQAVPDDPITTDPWGAIGIQAVLGARVTLGFRDRLTSA